MLGFSHTSQFAVFEPNRYISESLPLLFLLLREYCTRYIHTSFPPLPLSVCSYITFQLYLKLKLLSSHPFTTVCLPSLCLIFFSVVHITTWWSYIFGFIYMRTCFYPHWNICSWTQDCCPALINAIFWPIAAIFNTWQVFRKLLLRAWIHLKKKTGKDKKLRICLYVILFFCKSLMYLLMINFTHFKINFYQVL